MIYLIIYCTPLPSPFILPLESDMSFSTRPCLLTGKISAAYSLTSLQLLTLWFKNKTGCVTPNKTHECVDTVSFPFSVPQWHLNTV